MSKGEREITSKLIISIGGERDLQGERIERERDPGGENTQEESNTQGSQMLDVQEERCHMSFWGKDMFICAYLH